MAQNTANPFSVAGSATAVTLFSAVGVGTTSGSDALARTVFNDSSADLYLKFGPNASATDFTVKIPASGYYEVPPPVYDGLITGVWSSADGSARCTEVVA